MIEICYNIEFDEVYKLEDNKFIIPIINWDNLGFWWDQDHQEWKKKNNE